MRKQSILLFFVCICLAQLSYAVRLPRLFTDGMVLQRQRPLPVWGWAEPGQSVGIQLGRQRVTATADRQGYWRAQFPPQKAGGPLTLTVKTNTSTATVKDVWIGDVWLCSGQSNIDTNIERVYPQYAQEIDAFATNRVRLFRVENEAALDGPRGDVRSDGWKTLSKENAWKFTALGYFLGKRMAETTGVVQGIVQSSWGGTPIEAWLPADTMAVIDPRGMAQSQLYADPELSQLAGQVNRRAQQRWQELLEQSDPGISGGWKEENFDDSAWPEADQYALPVPRRGFCGSYWVRQYINVDAAHAGQGCRLDVGTLIDADYTFVNGRQVGHTGYQYPPRRYTIPAGVLHEGKNTIVVRFVNGGASPAFVSGKPYHLTFADGHQIPLSQRWRVQDGTQMPTQPSFPTGQQNMAVAEWNGMLAPLAPMAMAGVVWYQGESNTGKAELYERELTALMRTWRNLFQQPQLPFAVVQLANYMEPSEQPQESGWARLRESQRRAVKNDARAGLVVALDLGEANDIHPLRKKEVAERAALVFDRLVFNKKKVLLSPAPQRVQRGQDGNITVTFDQPLAEGPVRGFELCGEDGKFRNVTATAKGSTVTLGGNGQRVRYAWKNNPIEANCKALRSALPATSFELEPISK